MDPAIEQILENDHKEVDGLLDRALASLDAAAYEPAYQAIDLFWARLAMHIRAEHLHLFPAVLRACDSSGVTVVIERLKSDHDTFMRELTFIIKQIRGLGGAKPDNNDIRSRLLNIRGLLNEHNRIEEGSIYTEGLRNLPPNEFDRLAEAISRELAELPPRFSRLEGGREPRS